MTQGAGSGSTEFSAVEIERILSRDCARIADRFSAMQAMPCILTDATDEWPARRKWSFDFFASSYGQHFGVATLGFDLAGAGKATRLDKFIDHLDKPFGSIPGIWVEPGGQPTTAEPAFDEALVWSFRWDPFKQYPELFEDISPFPRSVPNIVANLPRDVYRALQKIQRVDFHAIYIARKNTLTRLHYDFHHTFGCLAQFAGTKKVVLYAPADYSERTGEEQFDPEHPDYGRFPEMLGRRAYAAVLEPGDMLIIPPDWWHYTRALDHSITLSHNFFNDANFAPYFRCLIQDLRGHPDPSNLLARLEALPEHDA